MRSFWTEELLNCLRTNRFFSPNGVAKKMAHNSSAQAQTLYFMTWREKAIHFWKSSGAGAEARFLPPACTLGSCLLQRGQTSRGKAGLPLQHHHYGELLSEWFILYCTWQRKLQMDLMGPVKSVTTSSNAGEMSCFPHIYPHSSLEAG